MKRVFQHREGAVHGFTSKYGVTRLVWFEPHESVAAAYKREQLIKRWRREWKLALIRENESALGGFVSSVAGFAPPIAQIVASKLDASPPSAPRKRG